MSLIKSISGIRGTIGGSVQEGLNPLSITRFTAAYATFIKKQSGLEKPLIVVGRDARISGDMVRRIVTGTLVAIGCDVIDIDLATTPTTEMAVIGYKAQGGIIITASHNPKQWNALKLLGGNGEFLSDAEGRAVLAIAEEEAFTYVTVENMGVVTSGDYLEAHCQKILELEEVDVEAIRTAGFRVAFDSINSVGGIAVPYLLRKLGVEVIFPLFDEPTGDFAHNPEPLPHHLTELSDTVRTNRTDVGFSVDPDVDRLAIIDEKGDPFGEEYTLVAVADYLLEFHGGGNTVSNLSSTRALRDVTERNGRGVYSAAAVGEVNVVTKMKETSALIGGEGNGGVIFPKLHAGRDALLGIALFLTLLAKKKKSVSALRAEYPDYFMSKQRADLPEATDVRALLHEVEKLYAEHTPNTIDGVKIDFESSWVHIRPSNTEPIIRIYTEASSQEAADHLADRFREVVLSLLK
ncbi:phosphoglucosamine mutase [Porphyromonas circumdentaria]|uniref:phosphoglucosamine mutase n=1 Tax=Porphyromonas circumdentaria TaxID=29524 RepID=UPI0026DA7348|nr:phosphoglucosamine mutase [Porphyromonas circumdentaria]MDO4722998.1 phosphoglucosamine mutase [Porphyromonas circumdentaria]